jgi:hypothetical protein
MKNWGLLLTGVLATAVCVGTVLVLRKAAIEVLLPLFIMAAVGYVLYIILMSFCKDQVIEEDIDGNKTKKHS